MYRHWHRFGFSLPPFGFWFRGAGYFPRRDEEGQLNKFSLMVRILAWKSQ